MTRIGPLAKALVDSSPGVRRAALEALGALQQWEPIASTALKDAQASQRIRAVEWPGGSRTAGEWAVG